MRWDGSSIDVADVLRVGAVKRVEMNQRLTCLTLVLLLAGCGGGGSSSGSTQAVPVPTTTPVVTPSVAIQRALVQQSLSATQQGGQIAQYGSSSGTTLSLVRRAMSGERATKSTSICSNDTISTITQGASANVVVLVIDTYYDAMCTKLQTTLNLTLTQTSLTAATAVGNSTLYSTTGAVIEYDQLALTLTGVGSTTSTVSIRDDLAPSQGAAPIANLGIGCSVASASDTCSLAAALHLVSLGSDQAAAATVGGTVAFAGGLATVAISGSGTDSTGALNSTNVAANGPYLWSTTGGTLVDSAAIAGTLSYTAAGLVAGGTLSVSDTLDNAAATAAYTPTSGLILGTVSSISPAKPIATFSVNTLGSGTVTYANGTTATITNWTVQG